MTFVLRDLTGQRFGKLVARAHVSTNDRGALWRCECDCGGEHLVRSKSLVDGHVRSCGCLPRGFRKANSVWVHGDVAYIDMRTKRNPLAVCVIDAADLPLLRDYGWWGYNSRGYAASKIPVSRKPALMHRVLMGFSPTDPDIDHANGDRLDNRRRNLRPATKSQNRANARKGTNRKTLSRFKGVTLSFGRWRAALKHDGKTYSLGTFENEEAAAAAYDRAAKAHFGEFAYTNAAEHLAVRRDAA